MSLLAGDRVFLRVPSRETGLAAQASAVCAGIVGLDGNGGTCGSRLSEAMTWPSGIVGVANAASAATAMMT